MADRIFKGATRPAMMLGVPIIPCILVMGTFLLMAVWGLVFFGFVFCLSMLIILAFVIGILRYMSRQDDQRLNQYVLYLKNRPFNRNKKIWQAHSMGPLDLKKRGGWL